MMYPSKTPATMRSVENQMLLQNVVCLTGDKGQAKASSGPQSKMPLLSSMLTTCHTTSQKATGTQRVRARTLNVFLSIGGFVSMGQLAAFKRTGRVLRLIVEIVCRKRATYRRGVGPIEHLEVAGERLLELLAGKAHQVQAGMAFCATASDSRMPCSTTSLAAFSGCLLTYSTLAD